MRQPAGAMAWGLWLIELLPVLHTEQELLDGRRDGWNSDALFEDALLFSVELRQRKAGLKMEVKKSRSYIFL